MSTDLYNRAFVDYYKSKNVSPVSQDITDLSKHFNRRAALYRHIGLPPALIKGKRVVEFGPGGGHNAVYTASLEPEEYDFVEINPSGLKSLNRIIEEYFPKSVKYTIFESYIEDFETDNKYDVVLCEGVIVRQNNPEGMLKHIAKCVAPGGVLVITCADSVSLLAEFLRKVISDALVDKEADLQDQIDMLKPVFANHFKNLKGMSRPLDDWIVDNLLQPIVKDGKLFAMKEAIEVLKDDFYCYNASPNIFTDKRWYKSVDQDPGSNNALCIDQYMQSVHLTLDYKFDGLQRSITKNAELIAVTESIFQFMKNNQDQKGEVVWKSLLDEVDRLIDNIREDMPETASAIGDYKTMLTDFIQNKENIHFGAFEGLFGRGMQYLSFIKSG